MEEINEESRALIEASMRKRAIAAGVHPDDIDTIARLLEGRKKGQRAWTIQENAPTIRYTVPQLVYDAKTGKYRRQHILREMVVAPESNL